jgi:predicted TPR repeat methyltransferase
MTTHPSDPIEQRLAGFRFRFAQTPGGLDQDQEWCEVMLDGHWQRLRFHDYHEIYQVPGLYEALFYRRLKCSSPARVAALLDDVMSDFPESSSDLRVLDVGAGNGMVAEQLRDLGVSEIIGLDIIPEAREAALRDRPDVYREYHVADLTHLPANEASRLRETGLNCLTCVAALGFGDIPPAAFVSACNLLSTPGWLVFNIKENFLTDEDPSGFSGLINRMVSRGVIQIQAYRRYCHRLSIHGEPLHYVAMVAIKRQPIPADWAAECAPR